ncbi:MAG: PQQ-binding-like beta-propeller repeat protein, partial [Gallionella sp.]
MPALLLGMLVALGGCASSDSRPDWAGLNKDAVPATLFDFKQTARFEVRWHTGIGDLGPDVLQTALTRDAIYCATDDGNLLRLDAATGEKIWRIKTGMVISGGVSSGDGMVFVGSN